MLCPEPTPGSGRSLARLSEEEDQHKMVASTTVFVVEPGSSPVGEAITRILDIVDDNLVAAGKVEQKYNGLGVSSFFIWFLLNLKKHNNNPPLLLFNKSESHCFVCPPTIDSVRQ